MPTASSVVADLDDPELLDTWLAGLEAQADAGGSVLDELDGLLGLVPVQSPSAAEKDPQTSSASDAPVSDRRTRRTEIERLSRRRRQATLRGMRDEVAALEREFAAVVSRLRLANVTAAGTTTTTLATAMDRIAWGPFAPWTGDIATEEMEEHTRFLWIRRRFRQLVVEAHELEEEQAALRRRLHRWLRRATELRQIAFSHCKEQRLGPSWDAALGWSQQCPALSLNDCDRIIREAIATSAWFERDGDNTSDGVEVSDLTYLGWRQRQRLDTRRCIVDVHKRIVGATATQLLNDTWEFFISQEAVHRVLMGGQGLLRLRVLRRVSDDIVVIHRAYSMSPGDKAYHTVFLVFRVRMSTGWLHGMWSIPAPSIQASIGSDDEWTHVETWMRFEDVYGDDGGLEGCDVSNGGVLDAKDLDAVRFGSFGVMLLITRWERALCPGNLLVATS